MNHTNERGSERNHALAAFIVSFCKLAVVLSLMGAASCTQPSSRSEAVSKAVLDSFWSGADESIHDAQKSLRSAKQVSDQVGGEVAEGDYNEIIALGHRLGGLGHDHASPADNVPVVAMLDSMVVSIEALIQMAATGSELEDAKRATEADMSKLSPRTQRLFHLLRAKKNVMTVRERAIAIGFRPAP